jgi:hypothetical protein
MSVYEVMMNDSESWTWPKACEVCISAPRGISPRK